MENWRDRAGILVPAAALAVSGIAVATLLLRRRQGIELKGRVVLITGGSKGLGLALAREFAKHGARLALCARSLEELEQAQRELYTADAEVAIFACDVSDREQVAQMIRNVMSRYGRIDVLVNNAGTIQVGPIADMTVEDFERAMGSMFWGTVYSTLETLPHMEAQRFGRIVNVTSVGAKVSVPHLVPYSCAKFAAAAFSEGLRAELRPVGIKVVTIAPGLMRTGSYLNAVFKGKESGEAGWFSAGASMPGISISASRAAREIVCATRRGTAERILGLPANVLARFHGVFPGLTSDIMGIVNRLLPGASGNQGATLGADVPVLQQKWMMAITTLGRKAAEDLQPAAR